MMGRSDCAAPDKNQRPCPSSLSLFSGCGDTITHSPPEPRCGAGIWWCGRRMEAPVQDVHADGHTGRQDFSVLICGDAPLESEANASIRGSIRDGWIDALSAARVFTASLDSAVVAIQTMRPNLVLCVGSYLPETAYFGEATRTAREVGSA